MITNVTITSQVQLNKCESLNDISDRYLDTDKRFVFVDYNYTVKGTTNNIKDVVIYDKTTENSDVAKTGFLDYYLDSHTKDLFDKQIKKEVESNP